ncbi:hypothetical protein [Mycobacteroides franklinii]|uniref:hypothetical protein n=1 Tax=Mycobacteroides franklinii TaxID=948102 RepID=UPI0013E8DDC4
MSDMKKIRDDLLINPAHVSAISSDGLWTYIHVGNSDFAVCLSPLAAYAKLFEEEGEE